VGERSLAAEDEQFRSALLQSRRWTGSGHGTGGLADCGGHGGAHALSDCVRSRPAALSSPTPRSGREYALVAEQLLYRGPAMGWYWYIARSSSWSDRCVLERRRGRSAREHAG